uniref:Uncharacterized protein n=1 Tax=Noctiluca scintillans TaxID=2966 RepID=A0A7S1AQM8_NOCSC|mmetsp:Transcript_56028/g.149470  ORF Transcript_56028/g.149470 Transcript_56028/m.149470 type:complete len:223 (+) Transcript_56028:67-735(+)
MAKFFTECCSGTSDAVSGSFAFLPPLRHSKQQVTDVDLKSERYDTPEEAEARRRCTERKAREAAEAKEAAVRESQRLQRLQQEESRLSEVATRSSHRKQFRSDHQSELERVEEEMRRDRVDAQRRKEIETLEAKQLEAFLEKHMFMDINEKKMGVRGWRYPLHFAVLELDVEVVRLLLKAGARTSVKSTSGSTPLDKARRLSTRGTTGCARIVALLEEAHVR